MGQYYRIFMCEEDGSNPRVHSSYDHDHNGAKLMEHSYYHNRFVEAACSQLRNTYRHDKPLRVWWVGDYANVDDIPDEKKKYLAVETAWQDEEDKHLKVHNEDFDFEARLYLINLTTHEYIDLKKVCEQNRGQWGESIHPLPLLTAVGNGRGGGDYHGNGVTNLNMVGAWAGDLLQIVEEVPKDTFLDYIDVSEDVYFSER